MSEKLPRSHGPWMINESRYVYEDPWLSVRRDEVTRPDGRPGTYSVVTITPGVCVVAWEDECVFLTSEFHYAVGKTTLEAVSGGRDQDESSLDAAKRELKEELGIVATTWRPLMTVDPFTASVVSPTKLFLATDLEFGEPALEGTEQIQMVTRTVTEAYEDIQSGKITHTPSVIALMTLWIQRQVASDPSDR